MKRYLNFSFRVFPLMFMLWIYFIVGFFLEFSFVKFKESPFIYLSSLLDSIFMPVYVLPFAISLCLYLICPFVHSRFSLFLLINALQLVYYFIILVLFYAGLDESFSPASTNNGIFNYERLITSGKSALLLFPYAEIIIGPLSIMGLSFARSIMSTPIINAQRVSQNSAE